MSVYSFSRARLPRRFIHYSPTLPGRRWKPWPRWIPVIELVIGHYLSEILYTQNPVRPGIFYHPKAVGWVWIGWERTLIILCHNPAKGWTKCEEKNNKEPLSTIHCPLSVRLPQHSFDIGGDRHQSAVLEPVIIPHLRATSGTESTFCHAGSIDRILTALVILA